MLRLEMVHGDRRLWAKYKTDWRMSLTHGVVEEFLLSGEQMAIAAVNFYKQGCDRFTLHLEDTILVLPQEAMYIEGGRELIAFDTVTGKHHYAILTEAQLRALLRLCLGGEDTPYAAEDYELLAEPLAMWPVECRPVP